MGVMDQSMMNNGMGMGQGQGQGFGRTYLKNFRASMFESWVCSYSLCPCGTGCKFVLEPSHRCAVRTLTDASQHIAEGHYDERVSSERFG